MVGWPKSDDVDVSLERPIGSQVGTRGIVSVARLIEDGIGNLPTRLMLRPADILVVRATGGRVQSGEAVEMLGPFVHGVVDISGSVRAPAGAPNAVLFIARRTGMSRIDIVMGDTWRTTNHVVEVEVLP